MSGSHTLQELVDIVDSEEKLIPDIVFDEEEGFFELYVYEDKKRFYEVDIKTCRDHESLVRWIMHLSGKRWFTKDLMEKFVETWGKATGLAIHGL